MCCSSFSKVFGLDQAKGKQIILEIFLKAPFKVSPTGKDHHSSTLLYLSKNRVRFFFSTWLYTLQASNLCFQSALIKQLEPILFSQPTFRGLKTHPDRKSRLILKPSLLFVCPTLMGLYQTGAVPECLQRGGGRSAGPVVNTFPGVAHTFS